MLNDTNDFFKDNLCMYGLSDYFVYNSFVIKLFVKPENYEFTVYCVI